MKKKKNYGSKNTRTREPLPANLPNKSAEILEMVDEIRQLPPTIHFLARGHDALGQWAGTAREHANLGHVRVLLLDKLQETRHIGTSKVIHGLESREHRGLGQPLEVVLADVLER